MKQQENPQRLPPGQQLVAPGKWPYVGEREPAFSDRPWSLSIEGAVKQPHRFSIPDLLALSQTKKRVDIHCVTRWSKFDAQFSGVLLTDLLAICGVMPDARFVSFEARSDRQHSSSLPLQDARDLEVLLATHFEGEPLAKEHGGPLRGVVPGRYFYKSVKWVERILLMPVDQLGYWESASGYHNVADPWREQRYISGSISKREAEVLMGSRDFRNRDLLSIDVSHRDLTGLRAERAIMRNANLENARLMESRFCEANLSNACFKDADLRNVSFLKADLEGVDFSGADLRSADLSGASLFGASFCQVDAKGVVSRVARFDQSTKIDDESIAALTALQQQVVNDLKRTGRSL